MILAFAEQSDLERDIWLLDLHATDLPSSRDKILALRGGQDQVVTTWVQERDYGLHGPMANDHVNVYLSLTSNTEQKHAIVAHLPTNRKVPLPHLTIARSRRCHIRSQVASSSSSHGFTFIRPQRPLEAMKSSSSFFSAASLVSVLTALAAAAFSSSVWNVPPLAPGMPFG